MSNRKHLGWDYNVWSPKTDFDYWTTDPLEALVAYEQQRNDRPRVVRYPVRMNKDGYLVTDVFSPTGATGEERVSLADLRKLCQPSERAPL